MRFLTKFSAALAFLAASPQRLQRTAPDRCRRLGLHLMVLAAAWGLLLACLWEATYRLTFPRLLNWIVPACVCAAATVLGPYRRPCLSLADTVARLGSPRLRWTVLLALAGIWAALDHALGWKQPHWPTQLPPQWAWLWPKAMYRVLLLSPLWGAWSMLATGQFHRARSSDPHARHFAEGVTPITLAATMVVPLAGTFLSLLFVWPPLRFAPPVAALATAVGGGTLIVRLRGGLDREALLATNVATQLVFLATAVAVT